VAVDFEDKDQVQLKKYGCTGNRGFRALQSLASHRIDQSRQEPTLKKPDISRTDVRHGLGGSMLRRLCWMQHSQDSRRRKKRRNADLQTKLSTGSLL